MDVRIGIEIGIGFVGFACYYLFFFSFSPLFFFFKWLLKKQKYICHREGDFFPWKSNKNNNFINILEVLK